MITQYALRNKNLTPLLLTILCACCALTTSVHAQAVHIPDPNLRQAVSEALNLPAGDPITQADMRQLTSLNTAARQVTELAGLEFATNLRRLFTGDNPKITGLNPIAGLRQLEYLDIVGIPRVDITPIAKLTNLRGLAIAACHLVDISPVMNMASLNYLDAGANQIVDITPLANLTNLTNIRLNDNRIVDITPLANLNKLDQLIIDRNAIVDVRPLSGLTQLQVLEIHKNRIVDHSPLDGLSLSHFTYDEACEMPPLPLEPRVENRDFPSIFARWSGLGWPPISNRPDLSGEENLALHDLRFSGGVFGLDFREVPNGFAMVGVLDWAVKHRDELLSLNPNMIHLVDVGIRAAPLKFYPEDSPYWIRDEQGNVYLESPEVKHGLLDFTKPVVQDLIVEQAIAVSKCGLYDGIFFDYWSEAWTVLGGFRTLDEELAARDTILQRIRTSTRPNFLIMGNVNAQILPRTAPYVNGGFMETVLPFNQSPADQESSLTAVENTLTWLDANLREPRINGLEGWAIPTEPADSPTNLQWMRAFTTLSLTYSDGYVVFTEPFKWSHYWYDFWDADLGRPVGEKGNYTKV
ncbi:MAG: leucine-rich repeat domain-containing protein [Candidatus Poribacteria bacterium]|nr:leucine-rich repeat domain-containing protein [Candidatus Poribacteria bacterium]